MLYKIFNKFAKNGLWTLISLLMIAIFSIFSLYLYMEIHLPNVEKLHDIHMQVPLKIYTSDGKLIAEFGTKRRIPVSLEEVPKELIQAILATEDSHYFQHSGVSLTSLFRAAKAVLLSGKKIQGGSTITMQVARNFFLTRQKTYARKFNEILLALKIDRDFSKEKILELYLNKIYLGERAYGVAAAAQIYYGKKLNQLTLPQMAMIAGLPQAPSRDNPITNAQRALNRRNHVLERMLELGCIDEQRYQQAISAPITAALHTLPIELEANYVAETARHMLVEEYGESVYEKGWRVYTTIDSKLQKFAQEALVSGLLAYSQRHPNYKPVLHLETFSEDREEKWQKALKKLPYTTQIQPVVVTDADLFSIEVMLESGQKIVVPRSQTSWRKSEASQQIGHVGEVFYLTKNQEGWILSQLPQIQGALIAINPQNGALLALMGGFDFKLSNFNRALQARRQPGSSFKPFIYSAALNQGYTFATTINDAPIVMRDSGENEWWRPKNDNNQFYGPTRLRIGLIKSRNLVSIRLLQMVGINNAINYLERFGFKRGELPKSLSLALGSASVTPLEMTNGYAVFANGGYRIIPFFINKIVDQENKLIYQAEPVEACEVCIINPFPPKNEIPLFRAPRVITAQNAYLINNALKDVIKRGTGRRALSLHRSDIAGKTGTTNNQIDGWFIGYNSEILTTVWVGFDNLDSLHEYGSRTALPIWKSFMGKALQNKKASSMPQPPDMITIRIDPTTGLLANPHQKEAIFEIFREEFVPTKVAPLPFEMDKRDEYSGPHDNPNERSDESPSEMLF